MEEGRGGGGGSGEDGGVGLPDGLQGGGAVLEEGGEMGRRHAPKYERDPC